MKTKLSPTSLYELASKRYEEVSKLCQDLENRIENYRPGNIHVVTSGRKAMFYFRTDPKDKSGKYISKKNQNEISYFLQKKYDISVYLLLVKEKEALEKFLKNTSNIVESIQIVYSNNPEEIKKYIAPVDVTDEEFERVWSAISYVGKDITNMETVLTTNRGEQVRSKSELNIANMLDRYGIPYKYECPLTLMNGTVVYPDFTVLNVRKRKVIYWEHRGMMDDVEYAGSAIFKVKSLGRNGITLGNNLIITEETKRNGLGTDEIERTIRNFLT